MLHCKGMKKTITVQQEEAGQRLDIWCVAHVEELSRSAIQKAIRDGKIQVNNQEVKPRYEVQESDKIYIEIFPPTPIERPDISSISIPIIFEDKSIVIIQKPAGILAHPAPGDNAPSVSEWFASRYPESATVGESDRPGIVHRIDKDTSGIMALVKTNQAHERLKEQFKRHRVRKEYLALVFGIPGERKGRITKPIGRSPKNPRRRTIIENGKPAITEWKTEETFGNDYSLLRVYPLTGRTHQIRVHLHALGFPIVGDSLYVFKRKHSPEGASRQMLHAESLTIQLLDGKKKTFTAELAEDFASVLQKLRTGRHE